MKNNGVLMCGISKNSNQSGFSIASVMIAITVISIVALGISTMLQNSMKTVTFIEDKQSALDLKNEIMIAFSDSRACRNTLRGFPVAPNEQPVEALKNKNDRPLYTNNRYDQLIINRIQLERKEIATAPNASGRMDLIINISRERSKAQADLKPLNVPLSVTTDSSSRIEDCVALGSSELANEARKCEDRRGFRVPSSPGNGSAPQSCRANDPCTKYEEGSVYRWRTGSGSGADGGGSGHDYHKVVCINAKWVEI